MNPNSYFFKIHPGSTSPFRLLKEGVLKPVSEFNQEDIEEFRLFLSLNIMSESQFEITIPLKISTGIFFDDELKNSENMIIDSILKIRKVTEDLKRLFFKIL